jgi:hypothetical protein
MTARYPVVLNGPTFQELQIGDTLAGQAESGANSDITSLTGLTTALSVAQGGTGVTTSTGTGNVVLSTSPTLVTPILGTPTSGTLTNCTGYTFTNIASKPTTLSGYGITDAILSSTIGAASGIAPLGSDSKIASTYLPSYVDDVLEYANLAGFPGTGETAKIYVALDTNKIYRWSGSAYIEISPTVGNSDTATKLATARSIAASGDATWTVSFDGSANATAAITLASVVTAATGTKVTYNAKGLITGSTTLTVSDITDIATNYQAKHANLTAVAGLSTATTGLIKFTNGVASFDSNTYVISGGALGTPTSGTLTNCTFPTLNQNTTGTAAGLSATLAIASGGTGATSAVAALTALGAQAALVSGTSIKTVNGTTLLGSGDLVISGGASATKTIANKTAAYTVIAGDLGKIINFTGSASATITLTAAATLGAGFICTIWNTSTTFGAALTIDPNLTETIGAYTTYILRPGEGVEIVCDGTNWQTASRKGLNAYAENWNGWTRPIASGNVSMAFGDGSATANQSFAHSLYTGAGNASATNAYGWAIGMNSTGAGSVTATGLAAMALGGSYASGVDSFAAAIANNTSSYGALGANSIAFGQNAKAASASSVAAGSNAQATGINAIAIGTSATSSSNSSVSVGVTASTMGLGALAIGYQANANGNYDYANAIGFNSYVRGYSAVAIGNSYASGTDSFAAAIANNTSSYGARATGAIALGLQSSATGNGSIALGYNSATASGTNSLAIGYVCTADGHTSVAIGDGAHTKGIRGKFAFSPCSYSSFVSPGSVQSGKIVMVASTTTTTTVVLTSDANNASTNNQLIVQSNQAMTFFGTLIAKQSASANMASYLIKGAIVNNAGTVSISSIAIETIVDTIGLTTQPTFTADNTNKALTVTSGAKATTNIRWVCNLDSVEVTYA